MAETVFVKVMPRKPALPEQLRYLQPFRKKFGSRPEQLNEEEAEGPIFELMSKRIKGLSESDAQQLLEDDLNCLESWLSVPENENDCLQFVRGFLLVSPSGLAKRIREETEKPPPPLVEIDLPDEVKCKRIANREEAALILRWKGLIASLQAMPEEMAVKTTEILWKGRPQSGVTLSTAHFGGVGGSKCVNVSDQWFPLLGTRQKEVEYLLQAPGGLVFVMVAPISKRINHETWDESIFENLFHTLRVV